MRRSISCALLMGCSLAASCVRPTPVRQVEPAAGGAAVSLASSPPSMPVAAAGAVLPGVDLGWYPWRAGAPTALINRVSGNAGDPGPFRNYFLYPAGYSLGAHRNTIDLRVTVRTGREYILMGDLDSARVQHFDPGTTFQIPAGTWHVEWFETQTLVEVEGVGPRRMEMKTPDTSSTP